MTHCFCSEWLHALNSDESGLCRQGRAPMPSIRVGVRGGMSHLFRVASYAMMFGQLVAHCNRRIRQGWLTPFCCRQHDHPVAVTTEEDAEDRQGLMASLWDSYWGYDIVRAEGLLERTFTCLKIPETSWPGLKVLPEVLAEHSRLLLKAEIQSWSTSCHTLQ